MATNCC